MEILVYFPKKICICLTQNQKKKFGSARFGGVGRFIFFEKYCLNYYLEGGGGLNSFIKINLNKKKN